MMQMPQELKQRKLTVWVRARGTMCVANIAQHLRRIDLTQRIRLFQVGNLPCTADRTLYPIRVHMRSNCFTTSGTAANRSTLLCHVFRPSFIELLFRPHEIACRKFIYSHTRLKNLKDALVNMLKLT